MPHPPDISGRTLWSPVRRYHGFANVGVFVGEEGALLVDSQFEPHATYLVAEARKIIDVYNGGTLAGTIDALDLAISLAGPNTMVMPDPLILPMWNNK